MAKLAWICAATILVPSAAYAFILPADAVLGGVAKRRDDLKFKTLLLEGKYEAADGKRLDVWEVISSKGVRRRELRTDDGSVVELTKGKSRWTFRTGEPNPKPERLAKPDPIDHFLAARSKDLNSTAGIAFLTAHGIERSPVSLGRFEGRVVYIIGAKPWEPDKPQLWVDKTLKAPVRLITTDPSSKARLDIRMSGYKSPQTDRFWPQRIEVHENGELKETITYRRLEVNAPVDSALFSPG